MSNNQHSGSDQLRKLEERINGIIYLSEFWNNVEENSGFALMGPKEKAYIGWKDRMQYHLSVATVSGNIILNFYDKDAKLISLLSLKGDILVKYLWKK